MPFEQAREWARALAASFGWRTQAEWNAHSAGNRPHGVPGNPHKVYTAEDGWRGYPHWLGVDSAEVHLRRVDSAAVEAPRIQVRSVRSA